MNDFLWQTYHRLITELNVSSPRYLYNKIDLKHRLTGIIGQRGVGKTTLMLQYIKNELYAKNKVFYFSADNTFFNETTILNLIDDLVKNHNIDTFFIDEIHKYSNWNQELKNIYDSFPRVKIIFSGSSSINLITGSYDLSRRAKLLYLPGFSFREFFNIKTNKKTDAILFADLIKDHHTYAKEINSSGNVAKYFREYLQKGYYPFILESNDDFYTQLNNIMDKTIYEDIANFYALKTTNLNYFKRIINFLASIPPGEIKTNNIAHHLGADNKTIDNYLSILQQVGLTRMLYPNAHGNKVLTKPSKLYLNSTTLLQTINTFLSSALDTGFERELFFLQATQDAALNVFYPDKIGDFQINDIIFEIGGKNKTKKQIAEHDGKKFLVKDNILFGSDHEIPLYLFGFMY